MIEYVTPISHPTDQGFSEEVSSITAVSRATKISQYRDELAQLGLCSKHTFKRSEWKGQSECKWAPVNLHAQVLEVNTVDQKTNLSCELLINYLVNLVIDL